MKSIMMYQLEGVRDSSAVSKIFEKYCTNGVDKSSGNIFLSVDLIPDFFKVVGYSSIQNTARLEKIADLITDEKYEKKADKFDQKYNKMHQKVMAAKRDTRQDTHINMGGIMTATSISELVSKAEQQIEAPLDPKVAKAQKKLDKYMAKNQILTEAKQYTPSNQGVANLISIGTEPKEKDIFQSIEESKKPNTEFIESSLLTLKKFLDELLKVADRVSVMHIMDGNKTPTVHLRTNVRLEHLNANQLIGAKNREIIIISK